MKLIARPIGHTGEKDNKMNYNDIEVTVNANW